MDWENHLNINQDPKKWKKQKKSKWNRRIWTKITSEKANSHSTLKLERKNFTPQNSLLFRSISCFGVTKITTPIWLQKWWKSVNRSGKKQPKEFQKQLEVEIHLNAIQLLVRQNVSQIIYVETNT